MIYGKVWPSRTSAKQTKQIIWDSMKNGEIDIRKLIFNIGKGLDKAFDDGTECKKTIKFLNYVARDAKEA